MKGVRSYSHSVVSFSKFLEKDQKHSRSATDILWVETYTKPINLPPRPKEKHFEHFDCCLRNRSVQTGAAWLSDLGDYLIIFILLYNKTVRCSWVFRDINHFCNWCVFPSSESAVSQPSLPTSKDGWLICARVTHITSGLVPCMDRR